MRSQEIGQKSKCVGHSQYCRCSAPIANPKSHCAAPPRPPRCFAPRFRQAKIGADKDIPHLPAALIDKYVTDPQHLGLL